MSLCNKIHDFVFSFRFGSDFKLGFQLARDNEPARLGSDRIRILKHKDTKTEWPGVPELENVNTVNVRKLFGLNYGVVDFVGFFDGVCEHRVCFGDFNL